MGKFDGKFVVESHENFAPVMLALGMTEDMCKKMLSHSNVMTYTLNENRNGSFTYINEHSIAPEFNSTTTYKIGERTEIKDPWNCVFTVAKKADNIFINRTEMGGKVMVVETTMHNYGMTIRGTVEGTALSFKEECKRVAPTVSGFYAFESDDKGVGELVKMMMPQMDVAEYDKMKINNAVRVLEISGGLCVDERFAGLEKKIYSFKFDEEYDYCQPGWNMDEKRVTTKTGPGCFTTVSRSKKDGKTWEMNWVFNDFGICISSKMAATEASEVYKRVPDIEGTWRMVTQCGMENFLDALGVTGAQKEDMIASSSKEYFTLEKMCGGNIKSSTNAKFYPSEMVIKIGETYTIDGGMGTAEAITTEQNNTLLNVMKFHGKIVTIKEYISGDFMVAEFVVDGSAASTMKKIMVRD